MATSPGSIIKASISAAGSGDNTLIAAVAGKRIRVHALVLVAAGAVTAQLRTGTGGAVLTGAMSLITGVPLVLPYNERGWFDTATQNALLDLILGGAVQVSGSIGYSLIS